MKILLSCIILFLIFNACTVLDLTGKGEKNCSLHNEVMKKARVRVHYGRACPERSNTSDYLNAKSIKCMGCIIDSVRYTHAVVWTCNECTKQKRKDK